MPTWTATDIDFPAGAYRAGTILDSDVTISPAFWFTTDLNQLDVAWDLQGIVAHELGHSHGLTHSAMTQKSPADGTAATMFNAKRDAIDRAALRRLHSDDIAWSSSVYPGGRVGTARVRCSGATSRSTSATR